MDFIKYFDTSFAVKLGKVMKNPSLIARRNVDFGGLKGAAYK